MVMQHGSNNETNFTKQFKEMTQEKLVQNFNQFFCKKTWRIFLLWPFLYQRTDNASMAVFILQSHYLSVRTWANILQFVWLCVTCIKMGTRRIMRPDELSFVQVIAWFVVIFGINTKSDVSKLLFVISRAVRRVKFETILKYHEWYLCQISRTNYAIICLYYYPQKV